MVSVSQTEPSAPEPSASPAAPLPPASLAAGQQSVLELIATGAPLPDVLHALVRLVEAQSPGLLCSVLVLDEDGARLRHGAAPSLPDAYNAAIDGIAIGPTVGSCGTAAFTRQPVIVGDIASDPLWHNFKDLALSHGLAACWSTPILAKDGQVLGTFAMYHRSPRVPTPDEQQIAARATHLATIALEREHATGTRARMLAEQAARAHAERLQADMQRRFEEAPAAICITRGPQHVFSLANTRYRQLIGGRDPVGKPVRDALPELEGQGIYELLDRVFSTGEPVLGENLPLLVDRSGSGQLEQTYFNFIYQPTRDERGDVDGIFVHAVDVTDRFRAEGALRKNLNVLQAVTEGTTDAIFVKDLDGRYLMLNAAATRILGTTPDQAIGKDATAFFLPENAAAIMARDRAIMESGQTRSVEEVVTLQGVTRTFLSTKGPYRDEHGAIIGLVGISRDITDRKRAELAQRFLAEASKTLGASLDYERTLERVARLAVPDLADWCVVDIAVPDPSRRGRQVLRRLASAHVDPAKVRLARDLAERYPTDPDAPAGAPNVLRTGRSELVPDVPAALLEQAARSPEHLEILRQLSLRSYISVPLTLQTRTFGVLTLVAAESGRRFDSSDLALAEELAFRAALAIHNAELYRELQERADTQLQLNSALREAAESRDRAIADLRLALRTRDEFLSAAAHDLKTPLAGIKGTAQVLRRRAARLPAEQQDPTLAKGLDGIDVAATRMSALITELLDLARADMGRPLALEPAPVDLVSLAAAAVEEQRLAHPSHHLTLHAALPTLVGQWDLNRLRRVLDNLLSNAIKFSPGGGEIAVSVDAAASGDTPHAILRVADRGIGIPSADLPHIFDRFHRGANAVGRIGGTGIGLASARTIVESHGGSISVQSEPGHGSTFTVRLPLSSPSSAHNPPIPTPERVA